LIKRIVDCGVALALLAALLPVMALIAAAIRLTSPGPAVIATTRVGRGGRLFPHYRFRTMAGQPRRKTRFGRLIGNLSLDDLPTLWNVVRGDMSLIGPRPEVPENVDLNDPDWQAILRVRPGLAGPGLLTFLERYNQTPVKERIRPDVYYAQHASWQMDLALMASTVEHWLRRGHLKGRF
jgi:lipopolysaccharide/colanic/teichoic acid biosynthesis glycosyltransferase